MICVRPNNPSPRHNHTNHNGQHSHNPARVNQLALTIKHTVEFSNNRRTPSDPRPFRPLHRPGQFLKLTRFFRPIKFASVLRTGRNCTCLPNSATTSHFRGHEALLALRCGFQPRRGHPAVTGWCPSARRADLENITHDPAWTPLRRQWPAAHDVSAGQGGF